MLNSYAANLRDLLSMAGPEGRKHEAGYTEDSQQNANRDKRLHMIRLSDGDSGRRFNNRLCALLIPAMRILCQFSLGHGRSVRSAESAQNLRFCVPHTLDRRISIPGPILRDVNIAA